MNKFFVLFALLFASIPASVNAGGSGCNNHSNVSWSQSNPYYALSTSQCVVRLSQSDGGSLSQSFSVLVTLPGSAQNGDRFLLKDNTNYSLDVCDTYFDDPAFGGNGYTYSYCYPGGITAQSADSNVTVDNVQSTTIAGFYYTSILDETGSPVSIPSGQQQHREQMELIFNSSTNNWDTTYSNWK